MSNRELDDLYLEHIEDCNTSYEIYDASETDHQEKKGIRSSGGGRSLGHWPFSGSGTRRFTGMIIGILIGVLICAGAFGVLTVRSRADMTELDYTTKIDLILSYLRLYYLNDLNEKDIETALAKGLMENIGDKYAQYYTPEEFLQLLDEMNGEYAGIGVQITMTDDGCVEVYKVFRDTPAQEAGIQIKDLIVEAAGERDFETLDDLVSIVRGEPGTTVDLVIERNGEEIPVTVERRYIETESVYSEMLSDTIGYIQIAEFATSTVQQFLDAIDSLTEQGMTAVIMDLRDDPGGDYDTVVAMCDRVVPEGPIVTVEDKMGGVSTENSDAVCLDIPIVLLVNENTASAAELFTMTLHDYGMAEIVGTQTYGKGIVQSIFRLQDGSGLKFTTEKYYGPNGNCIQDTGIEPDYVIELPQEVYEDGIVTLEEDLQLQKAAELLGYTMTFEEEEEAGTDE